MDERGIVLKSARGPVPSLAEAIAGQRVNGSWWSHARAGAIFRLTRALRASDSVLVCGLVGARITFVHRRLWPALVRVGDRFPPRNLARLSERHGASGAHVLDEIPFPDWVPSDVAIQASPLGQDAAWTTIRSCGPGAFDAA